MPHFLFIWNAGFGNNIEIIQAKNKEEADEIAYLNWYEMVHSNADYSATTLTSELCEEHGYDPGDYGFPTIKDDD